MKRFAPSLGPDDLKLMVVVGSEHRHRLVSRPLNNTRLHRLLHQRGSSDMSLQGTVKRYRVRLAVPVVRLLVTNRRELRELRALRLASQGLSKSRQQARHTIHSNPTHTNNGVRAEPGAKSC